MKAAGQVCAVSRPGTGADVSGHGGMFIFFGQSGVAKSSTANEFSRLLKGDGRATRMSLGDFFRAVTYLRHNLGYSLGLISSDAFFSRLYVTDETLDGILKPCVIFNGEDGRPVNITRAIAELPDKTLFESRIPETANTLKDLGLDSPFFGRVRRILEDRIRLGDRIVLDARPLPLELQFIRSIDVARTEIYLFASEYERGMGRLFGELQPLSPAERKTRLKIRYETSRYPDVASGAGLSEIFPRPGLYPSGLSSGLEELEALVLKIRTRLSIDSADPREDDRIDYCILAMIVFYSDLLKARDRADRMNTEAVENEYRAGSGDKIRIDPFDFLTPAQTARSLYHTLRHRHRPVPVELDSAA